MIKVADNLRIKSNSLEIFLARWKSSMLGNFFSILFLLLKDPVMRHGWRTGAILPELEVSAF